jgi:pimeloyl-ACP methyl ester carboxylesterase
MEKSIEYQGIRIHYSVEGNGSALLFLHGYLESSAIWKEFTGRFTDRYKVICLDIPGHGASGILGPVHEMEEMARVAGAVLDAEKISNVVVFGHSMGGYITMEFLRIFPERTAGYCLFHSTCFADNEEKKLNRDREISLVMCGKKMQIIHTNIPKAFADQNVDLFVPWVARAKEIAAGAPDEGIIALLHGMKSRLDHSALLRKTTPVPLLIWGKKDNYIGEEVFEKLRSIHPEAALVILKDSGHMGFIEEPENAYRGIIRYLESLELKHSRGS